MKTNYSFIGRYNSFRPNGTLKNLQEWLQKGGAQGKSRTKTAQSSPKTCKVEGRMWH